MQQIFSMNLHLIRENHNYSFKVPWKKVKNPQKTTQNRITDFFTAQRCSRRGLVAKAAVPVCFVLGPWDVAVSTRCLTWPKMSGPGEQDGQYGGPDFQTTCVWGGAGGGSDELCEINAGEQRERVSPAPGAQFPACLSPKGSRSVCCESALWHRAMVSAEEAPQECPLAWAELKCSQRYTHVYWCPVRGNSWPLMERESVRETGGSCMCGISYLNSYSFAFRDEAKFTFDTL